MRKNGIFTTCNKYILLFLDFAALWLLSLYESQNCKRPAQKKMMWKGKYSTNDCQQVTVYRGRKVHFLTFFSFLCLSLFSSLKFTSWSFSVVLKVFMKSPHLFFIFILFYFFATHNKEPSGMVHLRRERSKLIMPLIVWSSVQHSEENKRTRHEEGILCMAQQFLSKMFLKRFFFLMLEDANKTKIDRLRIHQYTS
jgi:hypothetical protein